MRNINSYAQHKSQIEGGGYPVRSTLGARKAENKAWSDGNFDATHEVDYPADAPADYTVEPTAEADLHNSGALVQKRSFALGGGYPVRSTLGSRKAENKAWSDGNLQNSHEPDFKLMPQLTTLLNHLRKPLPLSRREHLLTVVVIQ